jgi:8-oxo-dGTP diphosphatase
MKSESAGGVVFDTEGRVALVRQRDRRNRLRWTWPKGRLDPGESAEEAALREVYEETGHQTRLLGALGVYDTKRRRTHYFRMLALRDDGVFDDETEEVRFVKPERALRLLRSRRDRTVLSWATTRWENLSVRLQLLRA